MDVQGKTALITGAGSGIGRATAQRLARDGARVVVADINESDGHETVGLIIEAGGDAHFYYTDVTDEEQVQGAIFIAEDHFGGLDIVFNNAGTITLPQRFPEAESERWQRTLEVNLRGVILGTYHAIPALRRRGGGVVVQTASIAGLMPYEADPVYAATKAGVVNFTRSLTFLKEEANIRVNCVCPGVVRTNLALNARGPISAEERDAFLRQREQTAAQRPALQPEDVAEAVMRLIADDTLTGKAYRISAGAPWELL
ncbi:MAG: SDR family NAD(P)-dependent oxidoreductase [Dehalococcoidia bacterium]